MKKAMYGLVFGTLAMFGAISVLPVMAQDSYWDDPVNVGSSDLTKGQGQGVGGNTEGTGSKLIDSVKSFINWMLGMLATIALVICLYAGFLMVTSAGDEKKYEQGMNILKKAGIGLIIIGLAWLIVSVVMWLIGNLTA